MADTTNTAKITDEFVDPPSREKSQRTNGATISSNKPVQEFFDNLYTVPVPIDQNNYEAVLGFLIKKGFTNDSAYPIAKQLMAISYYSKKPVWYWLEELDILPTTTDVNLKIMQVLNYVGGGNFYLGVRTQPKVNQFVSRLLIK